MPIYIVYILMGIMIIELSFSAIRFINKEHSAPGTYHALVFGDKVAERINLWLSLTLIVFLSIVMSVLSFKEFGIWLLILLGTLIVLMISDVLIIKNFMLGFAGFTVTHILSLTGILYFAITKFAKTNKPELVLVLAIVFAVLAIVGLVMYFLFLNKGIDLALKAPVILYLLILTATVATAITSSILGFKVGNVQIGIVMALYSIAMILFYATDFHVAYTAFVDKGNPNEVWINSIFYYGCFGFIGLSAFATAF